MNISSQIQIIYVPWWVKLTVFLLMMCSISICGYLFFIALQDTSKSDWIAAGAYLLGIIFPILIVVIVIGGASFGEKSIIKRTERMLTKTIPYHLQFIPEETRKFSDFRNFRSVPKTSREQLASISLFHSKGRCYADYKVIVPGFEKSLELELRIELNIKRANVNVSFRVEHLHSLMKLADFSGSEMDFLRSQFPHTLEVERKQATEEKRSGANGSSTIVYDFSENALTRTIDNENYIVVVATTSLPEDTVWNPSEAVFFAQDLMFMIRAFLQERPEIFKREK